eukprot:5139523-Pleurochrysis_carterae.AAC.1
MDLEAFSFPNTWLTCLDSNNNPLNNVQTALITIHWNIVYKHMTRQKMDNKPFNSNTAQKDYCRLLAHRIQSLIKRLKTFHQSRQHGAYTSQHIHTLMENALHSLGLFNPHSGSFQLSNDIQQLLSFHDPLSDIKPFQPPI